MTLPDLAPDTVQATLDALANGEECPVCDGEGGVKKSGGLKKCSCCNGTGRTAPDLRMIDALVCRELGYELYPYPSSGLGCYLLGSQELKRIPAYCTDWGAGGPLLEEACRSSGAMIVHTQQLPHNTRIDIEWPDWDEPLTVWNDESELVARVCAWLMWRVRTGAEA